MTISHKSNRIKWWSDDIFGLFTGTLIRPGNSMFLATPLGGGIQLQGRNFALVFVGNFFCSWINWWGKSLRKSLGNLLRPQFFVFFFIYLFIFPHFDLRVYRSYWPSWIFNIAAAKAIPQYLLGVVWMWIKTFLSPLLSVPAQSREGELHHHIQWYFYRITAGLLPWAPSQWLRNKCISLMKCVFFKS